MHPELQAELEYGIENSYDLDPQGLLELVRLFHEQGEEADTADQEIRELRDNARKVADPVAGTLMDSAPKEVSFVYDLWRKDYAGALEKATEVSDALVGAISITCTSASCENLLRSWMRRFVGSGLG